MIFFSRIKKARQTGDQMIVQKMVSKDSNKVYANGYDCSTMSLNMKVRVIIWN